MILSILTKTILNMAIFSPARSRRMRAVSAHLLDKFIQIGTNICIEYKIYTE
jgi:hypothetical protein